MTLLSKIRTAINERKARKSRDAHSELLRSASTSRVIALAALSERKKRGDTRGQHKAQKRVTSATHDVMRAELALGRD